MKNQLIKCVDDGRRKKKTRRKRDFFNRDGKFSFETQPASHPTHPPKKTSSGCCFFFSSLVAKCSFSVVIKKKSGFCGGTLENKCAAQDDRWRAIM